MPRFAANLTLMYGEHAFADRFAAAAADGFAAVECLFPYALPAADIASRLRDHGLQQVLFNAPPGDWDAGERGIAALPGREDEFRRGLLEQALPYAVALGCPRLHVMAGVVPAGAGDEVRAAMRDRYIAHLAWAAPYAASAGVTLLVEPLNARDMPGYLFSRQAEAHDIVAAVGAPSVQVQMDLYHAQITEGDLTTALRRWLPTGRVGHLQLAGVPGRHEPDVGEVNFAWLFEEIDRLGYRGWIGCEYRPRGATSAGLGWRPLPR